MSRDSGFLLEFIPMKIGAGMTFLEVAIFHEVQLMWGPVKGMSKNQRLQEGG
jgi:hypothetical protein